jgi:carbonic anhydrase/acetyltransferase-like protein (isoleucine patch superfamily)
VPTFPYNGKTPIVARGCYVAPTATLIGDVTLEEGASVWFGCVLRGDVSPIVVGARSNIQDNTVIHGEDGCPTIIGSDATVGHGAIIHAATVGDRVLVGMGAVLLSRCTIGPDTIIGARALVTQDTEIEAGSLVLGIPAKRVRPLTDDERARILGSAEHYVRHAAGYLDAPSQE